MTDKERIEELEKSVNLLSTQLGIMVKMEAKLINLINCHSESIEKLAETADLHSEILEKLIDFKQES